MVAYKNGSPVRVGDVADVTDAVEDVRQAGLFATKAGAKPAVLLVIYRQPGANIIATVDRINALLPQLRASIPAAMTWPWAWTARPRSGPASATSSSRC